MIDVQKIQIGDIIYVAAKVKYVDAPSAKRPLMVQIGTVNAWIPVTDIVTHFPGPEIFKQNDVVRIIDTSTQHDVQYGSLWRFIAQYADKAFLHDDAGKAIMIPLDAITKKGIES